MDNDNFYESPKYKAWQDEIGAVARGIERWLGQHPEVRAVIEDQLQVVVDSEWLVKINFVDACLGYLRSYMDCENWIGCDSDDVFDCAFEQVFDKQMRAIRNSNKD